MSYEQNYFGVTCIGKTRYGNRLYQAYLAINGFPWKSKPYKSERQAALEYDKKRISVGLKPLNILKKVS